MPSRFQLENQIWNEMKRDFLYLNIPEVFRLMQYPIGNVIQKTFSSITIRRGDIWSHILLLLHKQKGPVGQILKHSELIRISNVITLFWISCTQGMNKLRIFPIKPELQTKTPLDVQLLTAQVSTGKLKQILTPIQNSYIELKFP